ncbi:maleylpyruvate isomerase family mycothiol-dependent enzyme [Streptomyces sp. 4F14]|uniref:maleylpyruvate isomerase family mycothiol-dependent enzyme n=1 Tax=Streptomyces sp. 4F14 TaxID=3394380 RepID=UPI003A8886E2
MTATSELPRDPELPGRLLITERDALIPLLRARPDADFALPTTGCPDWSVRDVLAHCSSALMRVVENRFEEGVFSPESNDRDIADRADWPMARIVDELERGMTEVGPVVAASDGRHDGIALGEWIHAGDVREAWNEPDAYAGPALPDALTLLARLTRQYERLPLQADLDDADEPLVLGHSDGTHPPARYLGPASALVRLYFGRSVQGASYELVGVREDELNLFA